MENYFEKQYELRFYEMNEFAEASPATVLALLEETAAEHCYSIDYGLFDLMKQNIGWVLVSGAMEMIRYPKYKEKVVIRTWLSSSTTVKGYRENIIYDEQFNIIGRAKGLWLFFDIKRRRPVPVYEEIKDRWKFCPEESIVHDIAKRIEPIETAKFIQEYKVIPMDIDMYHHVNNIRYLQWLLDSIPVEFIQNNFMHFIDGRFMSEIQDGDEVVCLTEHSSENTFLHTAKIKKTNKICATATTIWKERAK